VQGVADRLGMKPEDPPVYLELTPPFTPGWVKRLEDVGAVTIGSALRSRLASIPESEQRTFGWRVAKAIAQRARTAGFAGVVLMGLRFETAIGEGFDVWHDERVAPLEPEALEAGRS
jgi:hypothetical protein